MKLALFIFLSLGALSPFSFAASPCSTLLSGRIEVDSSLERFEISDLKDDPHWEMKGGAAVIESRGQDLLLAVDVSEVERLGVNPFFQQYLGIGHDDVFGPWLDQIEERLEEYAPESLMPKTMDLLWKNPLSLSFLEELFFLRVYDKRLELGEENDQTMENESAAKLTPGKSERIALISLRVPHFESQFAHQLIRPEEAPKKSAIFVPLKSASMKKKKEKETESKPTPNRPQIPSNVLFQLPGESGKAQYFTSPVSHIARFQVSIRKIFKSDLLKIKFPMTDGRTGMLVNHDARGIRPQLFILEEKKNDQFSVINILARFKISTFEEVYLLSKLNQTRLLPAIPMVDQGQNARYPTPAEPFFESEEFYLPAAVIKDSHFDQESLQRSLSYFFKTDPGAKDRIQGLKPGQSQIFSFTGRADALFGNRTLMIRRDSDGRLYVTAVVIGEWAEQDEDANE